MVIVIGAVIASGHPSALRPSDGVALQDIGRMSGAECFEVSCGR
jgi:hypothetical protein